MGTGRGKRSGNDKEYGCVKSDEDNIPVGGCCRRAELKFPLTATTNAHANAVGGCSRRQAFVLVR
jgi:hypothetical protein